MCMQVVFIQILGVIAYALVERAKFKWVNDQHNFHSCDLLGSSEAPLLESVLVLVENGL